MTTLEIILIIIVWINLGLFICKKRNWYKNEDDDAVTHCLFGVTFAPLNLILTIVKYYLIKDWEN
jgi:hypothetical protein